METTDQEDEPFEAALARLESMSARLEDPATGLEEAIDLYEQAVTLARHCTERLEAAEQRVTTLQLRLQGADETGTDA